MFVLLVTNSSQSICIMFLVSLWFYYLKYLTNETEFVLCLAVLENSVLPIGWDSSHAMLKATLEL